jgi:hypothetical protein
MKNITVAVPDDVYRAARILAAQQGSSVSAMVAEYLRSVAERDAQFTQLEAQQRQIQNEIVRFRGGNRLSRDAGHDRAVR